MKLGLQWEQLRNGWGEARIRVDLEEPSTCDRAAQLLAPLQPFRAGPGAVTFGVVGHTDTVKRLLERLDNERIHGTLVVISSDPIPEIAAIEIAPTLREQWESALAEVPSDWSDLLAELELLSSDWFDRAALNLAPINPRRDGDRLALRYRSAQKFGYGGSPQMVGRCLERCDDQGFRGTVRILRVLSDSRPVQTQGPVWHIDGHMV